MGPELQPLGRALVILGAGLAILGLIVIAGPRLPWLGRLPGDIAIRKDGFSFYFPLASSLVLSALISLVLWFIGRFRR